MRRIRYSKTAYLQIITHLSNNNFTKSDEVTNIENLETIREELMLYNSYLTVMPNRRYHSDTGVPNIILTTPITGPNMIVSTKGNGVLHMPAICRYYKTDINVLTVLFNPSLSINILIDRFLKLSNIDCPS